MRNQWDLYVKNFGRIKEATITVSPFMMFVGKNNTGKSYLMMLLWGIITESERFIRKDLKNLPNYPSLIKALYKEFNDTDKVIIDKNKQKILLNMLNTILQKNINDLLERVFNFPIHLEKIKITNIIKAPFILKRQLESDLYEEEFQFIPSGNLQSHRIDSKQKTYIFEYEENESHLISSNDQKVIEGFLTFVMTTMINDGFYNTEFSYKDLDQPIYFPASRTGFMQTYRAIVGNIFDDQMQFDFAVNERNEKIHNSLPGTSLTLPVNNFLSRLQKYNLSSNQQLVYKNELEFLNKQILKGSVARDQYNQFVFKPNNSDIDYPLHVTSSLISELAPLSIFLSSNNDPDLWIIEEVEAHLHTEMQLKIARFLFRLVNKDKAIWITTHSDTLAQQINNLLTIAQRNDKDNLLDKLNYSEQDIISDLGLVHAYQFENVDDRTVITKLELGPYGFEMKTFNDTLEQLIKETDIIQNHVE